MWAWVPVQLQVLALQVQQREQELERPVLEPVVRPQVQLQLEQQADAEPLRLALEVPAQASTQRETHFLPAKCGEPSQQHLRGWSSSVSFFRKRQTQGEGQ